MSVNSICEILDIDYEEIKDNLPKDESDDTKQAEQFLNNVAPDNVDDDPDE